MAAEELVKGFMNAPAAAEKPISPLQHEQACRRAHERGFLTALNKIVESNGGPPRKEEGYDKHGGREQLLRDFEQA
jgi:hypothetical protein